jgi:hypothetical protein
MMWLGCFQLGETVPCLLRTRDAASTPTLPEDTPQIVVWRGATDVYRGEMPILDRQAVTGLFSLPLFLDGTFTTGHYAIQYRWVLDGGYIGSEQDSFQIVAGGHASGAVVSMYFYERPEARFLVQSTEAGEILPGKNPRIR